ncbi:MAG: amidohydrolase family protein [Candidatus Competibacterales bacterium]
MYLTGANTLMGLAEGRYDGHCHVFRADLPMANGRRYTPGYDATPEELCCILNQFGLDGALLVQPSFLGADNSYLLQALEKISSDERLTVKGVAVLDPSAPIDGEWLKALDQRSIIGVRLNLVGKAESFDYDNWRTTLGAVENLGWHVELHCEAVHLPRILPQLVRHHAKVVIDHFGLIEQVANNAGLRAILDQPKDQLWIKVSGAYRIHPRGDRKADAATMAPLREIYTDHLGSDRLVWGSDWPFTQFEKQMNYQLAWALA